MATVKDICQICCEATGDISSEALDYAKRALRVKYATLYDSHAWRESKRVVDGIVVEPALEGRIFLPYDTEEVVFLALSADGGLTYTRIDYRERDWIERRAGTSIGTPSSLPLFYRGENLAWPGINPGKFTFTTSDKSSVNVYIEGRDLSNNPVSESFIVQGIVNPDNTVTPASVTTENPYQSVTTLSKSVGSAPVSVTTELGASSISMPAATTELMFTQIILYPPPFFSNGDGTARTIMARAELKLKPDSLDSDMSVPRISHVTDALISFTLASLYTRLGNITKHQAFENEGIEHIKAAVSIEKSQAEFRQQAYPTVYEANDYLNGFGEVTSSFPFG